MHVKQSEYETLPPDRIGKYAWNHGGRDVWNGDYFATREEDARDPVTGETAPGVRP